MRKLTSRPLPVLLVALGLLAAALAGTALARPSAQRPSTTVLIRDGRYGKLQGQELISFKIEGRRVSEFTFSLEMNCHDSESGEDFLRNFTGRGIGGGRVAAGGVWHRDYTQVDGGREGSGRVEVKVGRNGQVTGSISVVTTGGTESAEDCHGFLALPMRRGPLS